MDLVGLIDAVAAPLSLPADDSDAFRVFARKRPLWEREDEAGEYDSVTTCGGTVYVHDARLDREHRTLVEHREFARGGARATVVFFGQTGTGRRSAVAFQERIAATVFDDRDSFARVGLLRRDPRQDLHGSLGRARARQGARGAAHEMHLHGAVEARADSKGLLEVLTAAALRSVRATANNEQSSRSHCVFTLTVKKGDREPSVLRLVDLAGSERNDEQKRHARSAVLETVEINRTLSTLKDCFRAVRGLDVDHEVVKETWGYTEAMVAEYRSKKLEDWRRRGLDATDPRRLEWLEAQCNRRLASAVEFTKIKPLAAPRESAHARKLRCPYRDTLLSKLLADMFLSPKHRVAVVSTLSPSATDVEHSRRTLETVCAMRGAAEMVQRVITVAARQTLSEKSSTSPWSSGPRRVPPVARGPRRLRVDGALEGRRDGQDLLRLPKPRLRAFCGGDEALAAALFQALRDESKAQGARARAARNRKTALMRGEALDDGAAAPEDAGAAAPEDGGAAPNEALPKPPSPAKAARPPAPPTNRCTFVSTGAGIMIHDGDARQ
ncbi:hypothetical protein JL721_12928 [Aureococcus anophagefferens]|nr:hypothetical protein JL721_12928 [Aureococcus anophagefferens]